MQSRQDALKYPITAPLFVVPKNRGVGWQVSGQVTPIATIFELIEDPVKDLAFAPLERSCFLLLGQQGCDEFPLSVG